ncbi:glycosyltransferase family 39 protein [Crossiella sp. SN42]|uniref:ArnT family glycosyltransferase n=1 Tax=Crossiella sp. SN42 TaxID=2944808 RepID=UPI00207CDA58|nr:glycosyltransferase family 39 protein [Crossiella sp. SN42]MCO1574746.1 glycosyltransferase family 39 protein [Crossiella sp. SN42]
MMQETSVRPALSRAALAIPAVTALALIAFSGGYGYHRDELYFIVAGQHPAWGYPDQPSFTPMIAALMDFLVPDSMMALRFPAALAAGLTVLFVTLTARELGGTHRAQTLAALATALSGMVLIPGHMLHTTTFDITFTAAVIWLLVKVIRGGNPKLLLAAGAILGVALHNKYLIGAVVASLLLALLLAGPRSLFRTPWLWAGAALAVLIWLPNLLWQYENGWPQLEMAKILSEGNTDRGGPALFLAMQALAIGPLLTPLWLAGLVRLLRTQQFRFLGAAFLILTVALIAGGGSPLYLFGGYPALLAAGALAVDGWLSRAKGNARTAVATTAGVLSAVFILPLALPLVPESQLDRIPVIQMNGLSAEQFGWPELTDTVTKVYDTLPPAQRGTTVIIAENFGEAAALHRYGRTRGLPTVHSGYRGYAAWERPPATARNAILIQPAKSPEPPAWAKKACTNLRYEAEIRNNLGIKNREQGGKIWLCENVTRSWDDLWPEISHMS